MREKTDSFVAARHASHASRLSQLSPLRGAPWPATRDELIEYAARSGAALQLLEELYALPDADTRYAGLETLVAPLSRGSRDRGVA